MSTIPLFTFGSSEEQAEQAPPPSTSNHSWRTTRKENYCKVWGWVAGPIACYVLMAVATATFAYLVHGRRFHISSTENFFERKDGKLVFIPLSGLRQPDIIGLISLAASVTQVIGRYCRGIACSRAAYILLIREGMSLGDIDNLVSFPFLWPRPWSPYRITISCIALLFLCSELFSPILNGAIAWKTAVLRVADGGVLTGVTQALTSFGEVETIDQKTRIRYWSVVHAATALVGGMSSSGGYIPQLWRVVEAAHDLPIDSILANITLPFFAVDSFEWIVDPSRSLDADILHSTDAYSSTYDYTPPKNPMSDAGLGSMVIIANRWIVSSQITSRESPVVTGRYYVAIKLGSEYGYKTPKHPCEGQMGDWLRYAPSNLTYYTESNNSTSHGTTDPHRFDCIAFARISIRAGAGTCRSCRIVSRFAVRNESEIELHKDPMTEATLHMMPEVSTMLSAVNMTLISPENGLDRYIMDTLTQAYCGTWTSLTDFTSKNGSTLETIVKIPVQASEAVVTKYRVLIWLLLNVLVGATCGAIVFVQVSTGGMRAFVDAVIGAILLNTTEVVKSFAEINQDTEEMEEADVHNRCILPDSIRSKWVRLLLFPFRLVPA